VALPLHPRPEVTTMAVPFNRCKSFSETVLLKQLPQMIMWIWFGMFTVATLAS